MSIMQMLFIAWGALTAVLVLLLIYRSTLAFKEDDQLFLDSAESHMEQEQIALQAKMGKLAPFVRFFGAASGMLILVMAGMWIYDAWQHF